MIKLWYQKIKRGIGQFFSYPVAAFAAQTAFFLIISAFPFAMLLIALIGYIPGLEQQTLLSEIMRIMPPLFHQFIEKIFNEIYNTSNITLISVAAISSLFAASKGFVSLVRGMNAVYGIKEQRNYFGVRLIAVACTGSMMLAIILTLILMVFGDKILSFIMEHFPTLAKPAIVISSFRVLLIFAILTLSFLLLYLTVPSRSSTLKAELPGAMFAATGWILFSLLYSCYLNHINTYIYGSLTAAVFIMLWLYFCIYIIFVGAELNHYLRLRHLQFIKEE